MYFMKHLFVSVIIATFNNATYLRDAIDSVLKQSYNNFELIIINDASTDATAAILANLAVQDTRVIVVTNSHRQGLTKSLNAGIAKAQGHI